MTNTAPATPREKSSKQKRTTCYACDGVAVGARDRRPEGGKVERACWRHAERDFGMAPGFDARSLCASVLR